MMNHRTPGSPSAFAAFSSAAFASGEGRGLVAFAVGTWVDAVGVAVMMAATFAFGSKLLLHFGGVLNLLHQPCQERFLPRLVLLFR